MASTALRLAPWVLEARARFKVDFHMSRAWSQAKSHFSLSNQLVADPPSAIALEKMPYPTTPVDHSIFEEESSEYTSSIGRSTQLPDGRIVTPVQILHRMVEEGRNTAAEALRADLVSLGVAIPPSHIYEWPAQGALYHAFQGDRLSTFTNWFSLIPDVRIRKRNFRKMQRFLFSAPVPQLDIIMRFGLIAASKGHIQCIMYPVIATVVRHVRPSVSTQYLADFEKECVAWGSDVVGREHGQIKRKLYNLAVRVHVKEGRLKDAMTLLVTALNRRVNISESSYRMFMRKLRSAQDEEGLAFLRQLAPPHVLDNFDTPSSLDIHNDLALATTLASRLRYLRQIIKPRSNIGIPHKQLLAFIRDYTEATGRETAIALLRKRAFKDPNVTSQWLLAELLYYNSRREYRFVLHTFARYFEMVGVPRDRVLLHVERLVDRSRRGFKPLGPRYQGLRGLSRKLWPTVYHTALVWTAVVRLSTANELNGLCEQLLRQARWYQAQVSTPLARSPDLDTLAAKEGPEAGLAMTSSHAVDSAHLTPFLWAFTKRRKLDRAAQLAKDMMTLGISPTVHHWTMLAAYCARHGNAKQALQMLDDMEADEDAAPVKYEGDGNGDFRFPAPTIATYTHVMKSFVDARRLDEALDVKARIMTRCHYVIGQRGATDYVLHFLHKLQKDMTNWCAS
jgi:pentatricopeptide repeat protein